MNSKGYHFDSFLSFLVIVGVILAQFLKNGSFILFSLSRCREFGNKGSSILEMKAARSTVPLLSVKRVGGFHLLPLLPEMDTHMFSVDRIIHSTLMIVMSLLVKTVLM
ncbi:hypothetical protein K501DRAFT_270354 [Backusella circina FSU 941]|nr:hypothetical protein K501DRAFT_270354 [Backusella circina FSU 941]